MEIARENTIFRYFRVPYGFSHEENFERNVMPFVEAVPTISPGKTVVTPLHLEITRIH